LLGPFEESMLVEIPTTDTADRVLITDHRE